MHDFFDFFISNFGAKSFIEFFFYKKLMFRKKIEKKKKINAFSK